ncbi:hypothetical protein [uncultured Chitinophaga sp.]|uniref:hypothetical protein n=1 Tax=uncultured Chitinophaga sp. TaxID=339340 RepID=UPI0025D8A835|nr:hypothetical protein [uncultured Chitinophaga sp.]
MIKKMITLPVLVLFCCISMAVNAATITLGPFSTGLPYTSASIDENNYIHLEAGGNYYIDHVILFSNVPTSRYWSETVGSVTYSTASQSAYRIIVYYRDYSNFSLVSVPYDITY